jgi:hypothetical protein
MMGSNPEDSRGSIDWSKLIMPIKGRLVYSGSRSLFGTCIYERKVVTWLHIGMVVVY